MVHASGDPVNGGRGGAERGKDKEGHESVSSWEGEMEKVKPRWWSMWDVGNMIGINWDAYMIQLRLLSTRSHTSLHKGKHD